MRHVNKKHDLINIKILDNAEYNIPRLGLIKFHDVELQNSAWIDTSNENIRNIINNNFKNKNDLFLKFCKNNNIDCMIINTKDGYLQPLELFFIGSCLTIID